MFLYRKNFFGFYKEDLNPPVAGLALSLGGSLSTEAPGVLQLHGVCQGPLLSLEVLSLKIGFAFGTAEVE